MPFARGEVERARARSPCRRAGIGGEAVDHQPRAAEAAGRLRRWSASCRSSRSRSARRRRGSIPRITGSATPPAHVRADRDRAGEVEQLDPGQPPQRIRRPVVAQLREQRRLDDPPDQVARRRAARAAPAPARSSCPPRRRHRAHAEPVRGQHARDADVDRLRRRGPAPSAVSPRTVMSTRPVGARTARSAKRELARRAAAQSQTRDSRCRASSAASR